VQQQFVPVGDKHLTGNVERWVRTLRDMIAKITTATVAAHRFKVILANVVKNYCTTAVSSG
jgi:hypothetical protein